MKKTWQIAFLSIVCAVLVAVPVLSVFGPRQDISLYENRTLASLEPLSMQTIFDGSFFSSMESALSDHIIGRDHWLRAYVRWQAGPLQKPVVNDIVLGDGVLVPYRTPVYEDPDYTQKGVNMAASLAAIRDLCESLGGQFVYVGIPEQSSAMRGHYPDYLYSGALVTDEVRRSMAAGLAGQGIEFVDMVPIFEQAGIEQYYFNGDHHYNLRGAYVTYRAILDRLSELGYDLPVLLEEDMEYVALPNPVYGSRSRQLYNAVDIRDQVEIYTAGEIPFDRWDNGEPVESTVFTLPENDEAPAAYTVYMGGDQAETRIDTHRPDLPKLLVFGDSFSNAVETFLYRSFGEMRSLDLRYYTEKTLSEYIREYQPDVVLCIRDDLNYLSAEGNGDFE